jgi:DNA-binding response OmpR family regulator
VDDDADTCTLIVDILQDEGYWVHPCLSGERALEILNREHYDLVLSDIKMPRVTGIDLLLQVRRMKLDTKVILMTAFASLQTAIQALRGEAFDYLIKPFSLNELRQRVRQALWPEGDPLFPPAVVSIKELTIDLNARRVYREEQEIELTRLEFDLLAYLLAHQNCVVSWQELVDKVWDSGERSVDTVRTCVRRLRKKIGDDAKKPKYIKNVWGVGYQLGD